MTRRDVQFVFDGAIPKERWIELRNRLVKRVEDEEESIEPILLTRCASECGISDPALATAQVHAVMQSLVRAGWVSLYRELTAPGGRVSMFPLGVAEAERAMAEPGFWTAMHPDNNYWFVYVDTTE